MCKPTNVIMNMKISNLELKASFQPTLVELAKSKTNARLSYNIAKTIKSVGSAIDTFDEARKQIIETRCNKDDAGKPVTEEKEVINQQGQTVKVSDYVFPNDDVKKEVLGLLQDLEKQEVDVEIYPVSLDDFGSIEISGLTLLALKEFVTE